MIILLDDKIKKRFFSLKRKKRIAAYINLNFRSICFENNFARITPNTNMLAGYVLRTSDFKARNITRRSAKEIIFLGVETRV